jgi:hypothetical protein
MSSQAIFYDYLTTDNLRNVGLLFPIDAAIALKYIIVFRHHKSLQIL